MRPFTVAVMQPYFVPYLGYFRLFAESDLFVIYDCVQFPRRGWVHRNQPLDATGRPRWLTLPLQSGARDMLIRDLRFTEKAGETFAARLRAFQTDPREPDAAAPVLAALHDIGGRPVDYIERLLRRVADYLDLPWNTVRSTSLGIAPDLRGQDRIIAIARQLGAGRYLNAPGGRDLYDHAAFAKSGITLDFLPDYRGPSMSVLSRIVGEKRRDLAREVRESFSPS